MKKIIFIISVLIIVINLIGLINASTKELEVSLIVNSSINESNNKSFDFIDNYTSYNFNGEANMGHNNSIGINDGEEIKEELSLNKILNPNLNLVNNKLLSIGTMEKFNYYLIIFLILIILIIYLLIRQIIFNKRQYFNRNYLKNIKRKK